MKITWFVIVFVLGLSVSNVCASVVETSPIAIITKIEGKAKVLPAAGIKKHKAHVGEGLLEGDRLISYQNTRILITLSDTSKIILNENAALLFKNNVHFNHMQGEIYYRIEKRQRRRGLQVETPFSIIGIKGTEFIVRFDTEGEIALNEGLIGVHSLSEQFELYEKKSDNDFKAFEKEQNDAFKAYQQQQEEGFRTYVKEFDLHANKVIRFSNANQCQQSCEKKVTQENITPEIAKHFKSYQMMIGQ